MFSRVTGSSPDRTPAVRILVVGNAGSGKTSLANLIVHSTPLRLARPTVGCNTYVTTVGGPEDGLCNSSQRQTFVELWDIGAHERYRALRSSFYVDVGGVIIVTDSADGRRRQASVRKWAAEVAGRAKFASALPPDQAAANPGSIPVPCLVINNKADLRGMAGRRGAWRRGLLTWLSTLLQQFKFRRRLELLMRPSSSSGMQAEDRMSVTTINASATQGVIDTAAVSSFFGECAALRLSGGAGAASAARAPVRRTAVQGVYPGTAQKPLLMHSPGHGSGPPLPSHMPYTSPQVESNGPASTSSWGGFSGGFSRTTSFHSTISASSDHAHAWEQAPRQRPAMADAAQQGDAGDDSADLV